MKAGRSPPLSESRALCPATSPVPTPDLGRAVTAESGLEAQVQRLSQQIGSQSPPDPTADPQLYGTIRKTKPCRKAKALFLSCPSLFGSLSLCICALTKSRFRPSAV